jgi:hypothetical protein
MASADTPQPSLNLVALPQEDALIAHLRVSELMYNPPEGSDYEFIELYNTSTSLALDLSGVTFTQGITFTIPNGVSLPPGGYLLVVPAASANNYGTFRTNYRLAASVPIVGPYQGSFNNSGEQVTIKTAAGGKDIVSFEYGDGRGWPASVRGAGHSLVPLTSTYSDSGSGALNIPANWRASAFIKGSPGAADPEPVAGVVFNEVVAHTDIIDPAHPQYDSDDWVELYNTTSSPVDLSGLFLSDDPANLRKWMIPSGTVVAAKGWVSFDEVTGFHNPITSGFGLDKAGEQVLLSFLPGNGQDRVIDAIQFKGQQNGVAWGRYPDGGDIWRPLVPSRGMANVALNLVMAITEIMYHPAPTTANPDDNTADEFIELTNPGGAPVNLYDTNGVWRIDGGVQFEFPTNTTVAPGGSLLVVNFSPTNATALASFRQTYHLQASVVPIFGPYQGKLKNSSDRVGIEKPQYPDLTNVPFSWIVIDEVFYGDQNPWPTAADGQGSSLQRVSTAQFGTDPANWVASSPNPGVVGNPGNSDRDGDGMPDAWESQYGLNPDSAADAALDKDGDGLTNLQEYLSGTNPADQQSVLKWQTATLQNGSAVMTFQAAAGKAYTVQSRTSAGTGVWDTFQEIPAQSGAHPVTITDANAGTSPSRFYRIVVH